MIRSKFVASIVDLLLDTHPQENSLRQQLFCLEESEIEYSGSGAFISFAYSERIKPLLVSDTLERLGGVKAESPELGDGAEASLVIDHGIIDYLEIWCYAGPYPEYELQDYTLTQMWHTSPGKVIKSLE